VPVVCTVLGMACGGDGSEPAAPRSSGQILVSASITGVDLPVTYSVRVADRTVSALRSSGALVTPLAPGNYSVRLSVPANCRIDGDNPRAVTVRSGQTAKLVFSVTCLASTGALRVTTVTTGADLDPDGYQLRIDGQTVDGTRYVKDWATRPNEMQILSAISIGETHVALRGLAVNCDPAGEMQRSVAVTPTDTVSVAFGITCAPDTAQIAYVVGMAPGILHVYVGTATGTRVRRLTADDASDEDPAWSPDGKKLAITTDRDGNREIYVVDADGSNAVRLTNDPDADYEPAWSRDGTRIAFVSERTGTPQIFSMNADGSNPMRLTTTSTRETDPAWSPDGRIAFSSERDGKPTIYVMNGDGSGPPRLTIVGGRQPAWSPDGTMLAYSGPYCAFNYCYPAIFIWSSSVPGAPLDLQPGERPSWSPDGRKLAYGGLECDFSYDYDYNITGTISCEPAAVRIGRLDQREVTGLARGSHPAWRP
jgi:hypothetical protein